MIRSMRSFLRSGWAAAALCSISSVALAQAKDAGEGKSFPECTRNPTEREVAAAKGAFEAGQVSFQEADYARAILYWEDAFRRDCTALALLLNLARAYELAGARADAVASLETYLARRPNATDRDQITRRIEALERQIEEERREREARAAPAPTPEPQATPVEAALEEPSREPQATTSAPLWPLYVAGGGVVVGVVGVVLWAAADQDAIDRCEETSAGVYSCPNQAATDAAQSAQRQQRLGMGLTVGGGALAVGGTITYFVLRSQTRSDVGLAPNLGPGFAGLSYSGRF